jgi:four helix bundle protein
MNRKSFENIIAWKKARLLAEFIYKHFRLSKDYGFRDQIQRAAVSVMNNIAEGSERYGAKEFRRFLYIAKGSSGEVRSMLILAKDLNFLEETVSKTGQDLAHEISLILGGLIKTLASRAS